MELSLKSLEQLCLLIDHSCWWIKVEEDEEAIEMIQKLQLILKFQMDLLVVEEEVADEVETRVVFSVNLISFFFLQASAKSVRSWSVLSRSIDFSSTSYNFL
ncbi:hypothetical protein Tco_1247859 [Tanacetum coccineum]